MPSKWSRSDEAFLAAVGVTPGEHPHHMVSAQKYVDAVDAADRALAAFYRAAGKRRRWRARYKALWRERNVWRWLAYGAGSGLAVVLGMELGRLAG